VIHHAPPTVELASGGKQNGPLRLLDILAQGAKQLMEGEGEAIVGALLAKIERQRAAVDAWLSLARNGASAEE
jgi:hypothetical protein